MDAHFFRKLAKELFILEGARVEKIHSPAHDILSMQLFLPEPGFMAQRKWRLIMRFGRKDPLLFLSHAAMPNPQVPPAWVMRLRKYVQDRKLGKPVLNWGERALALPFLPPQDVLNSEKNPPSWLLLDLKSGPKLLRELPAGFSDDPKWPDPEELADLLDTSARTDDGPANEDEHSNVPHHPWRDYPVLTPALRKALSGMDLPDAQALLIDLEDGEGDIFAYEKISGTRQQDGKPGDIAEISAWPLENASERGLQAVPPELLDESCPALSAAMRFGESLALADFGVRLAQGQVKPLKTEQKRLKKLLKKLNDEEDRLLKMRAERAKGLLIQANLYRYDKESKLPHITVETGQADASYQDISAGQKPDGKSTALHMGQEEQVSLSSSVATLCNAKNAKEKNGIRIDLDPKLDLLRNMEAFFKRSERGERGLRFLAERRALVQRELEASQEGLEHIPAHQDTASGKNTAGNMVETVAGAGKNALQSEQNRFYNVFKSSDGYTMLLGKSAKGNHELMRLALPHDYWLHSTLGQSAHLIIRRKHAADEVPENTMKEAGVLVGLKSWQSSDAKADIMCALGKDIRPLKKAAPGTAKINKLVRSFSVELDQDLPGKLTAE